MRAVAVAPVAAALLLAATGCAHVSPGPTRLLLEARNPSVGRATFDLRCDPPGGDVARPASACAALKERTSSLLHPKPFLCRGGPASWWQISITGRLEGRRVAVKTGTCWTPQMELIRRLGIGDQLRAHVVPHSRPRRVLAGARGRAAIRRCADAWNALSNRVRRRRVAAGRPYRVSFVGAFAPRPGFASTRAGCRFSFAPAHGPPRLVAGIWLVDGLAWVPLSSLRLDAYESDWTASPVRLGRSGMLRYPSPRPVS